MSSVQTAADVQCLRKQRAWERQPGQGELGGDAAANPESYGGQLKACAHRGDVERAEELLSLLEEEGQELSVDLYNFVIHACATSRDADRAELHIRGMEERGLAPNLVTYNSVINACAAVGDASRAEAWLFHMIARGIAPNQVTYGTMCKVFARHGRVQQIRDIMNMLEVHGGMVNEYFYASLISACGAATPPDMVGALRAFEELVVRGFRPGSVKRALERVIGQQRTAQLFESLGPSGGLRPGGAQEAQVACLAKGGGGGGGGGPAAKLGERHPVHDRAVLVAKGAGAALVAKGAGAAGIRGPPKGQQKPSLQGELRTTWGLDNSARKNAKRKGGEQSDPRHPGGHVVPPVQETLRRPQNPDAAPIPSKPTPAQTLGRSPLKLAEACAAPLGGSGYVPGATLLKAAASLQPHVRGPSALTFCS